MSCADSSRARSSAACISARAFSASARSRFADSIASAMVFSRVSIIWRMGPHANFPSTTISNRNVMMVQKLSAKLTSVRPAATSIVRPPGGGGLLSHAPARRCGSDFDGEDDADHLGEQGDAFDQRRGDDHRGADVPAGRRLAGGPFHGGGGEAADAESGAEDGEAGPDARGEVPERELVHCFQPPTTWMPWAPA